MPVMACFTGNFLVAVGVFAGKGGSPQSALGITILSLELLTVYLVIAQYIFPSLHLDRPFIEVAQKRRTHTFRLRQDRLRRLVARSPRPRLWFTDGKTTQSAPNFVPPFNFTQSTPSSIHCNPSQCSPKHLQEPSLCIRSMKDCGDDEMLDKSVSTIGPSKTSLVTQCLASNFNTQSESGHSVPDLESVAESDCDSIPDMLSISDSDTYSESRRSVPDLESAAESDCDSIPDLLSISNSDAQSESRHSVPDLESVVESDYENSTASVINHYTCDNCVPDLLFTMAGTDIADMTTRSNSFSKDGYITNWLSTSYTSTYKSAHPMTGGGGDPSTIAATLPTHSAPAEDSGSDAPLLNLLFN
ncbi:hypothetical protein PILCRDRAFT_9036 [Piloderma croceum F 1598]|uniref:Uncharacterized protein n=1 Tax=Piloderma croceum (strain F 1598) TaxID=765440 RepID=A0A0C3FMI5_PILCF|nr:hypothetical protein PILCRDRAFT_9036 [Piloderma croceum F 1598]